MKLSEYLNRSVKENNVNESLILGGMIGMMCVASAVNAVFSTDFMKNIGTGLGGILGGIGSIFGGFGSRITKKDNEEEEPKGKKGKKNDEEPEEYFND